MGIERPDVTKPEGRYNNAKMTFTADCRRNLLEIAARRGIAIEAEPRERSKSGLSLAEYQARQEIARRDAARAEAARIAAEAAQEAAQAARRDIERIQRDTRIAIDVKTAREKEMWTLTCDIAQAQTQLRDTVRAQEIADKLIEQARQERMRGRRDGR